PAASEPGTLSILRHVYPRDEERARALGVWAAVGGLALALGPVIGGVLTDLFTWRGVFWFNVVAGLGCAASVTRWVPESRDRAGRRLDLPGQLLGVVTLATVAFALIQGESAGWTSVPILALFAISAAAAVGFWAVERRCASPVLDLAFFRVARFTGANLAAFAASFGIFAVFFFLSLYVQLIANASPAATAAQFVPMAVAMIGAAPLAGRWAAARGPRTPVVTGLALAGVGMLLTDAVLHPGVAVLPLVGALLVLGAGLGTVLAPMTAAVMGSVPPARSGMAAAITNLSRQVGGVVAVALLGAITIAQLTASLTAKLHALGLSSFSALIIGAVTHGTSPASGSALAKTYGQIVFAVENAAEAAFVHGLHVSLAVAAGVLLVAGGIAAATLGPLDRSGEGA
ncbi:MAG: MFS transporter, partial [Mycobacteriales bacterium]